MQRRVILDLADATTDAIGVYRWSLSHQNEIRRPKRVTVGPCTVSSTTDHLRYTLLSDDVRPADERTQVGDRQRSVLYTVNPVFRNVQEYQAPQTGVTLAELEAMHDGGNGSLKFFLDAQLPSSFKHKTDYKQKLGIQSPNGTHVFRRIRA